MHKKILILLLFIFMLLVILMIYKNIRVPTSVFIPINNKKEIISNDGNSDYKETIMRLVEEYIINNPKILFDSINNYINHNNLLLSNVFSNKQVVNTNLLVTTGIPIKIGNKNNPDITIIMFYDYSCGYCKQAHEYNNQILALDQNIQIILRPISALGNQSMYFSQLALAIYRNNSDKFLLIHNFLMKMNSFNLKSIKMFLEQNSINFNIIEKEINNHTIIDNIEVNNNSFHTIGLTGVPVYIINGRVITGVVGLEKLQLIIKQLRDQAAAKKG